MGNEQKEKDQVDVDSAADVLIEAAQKGVRPAPDKIDALLAAFGVSADSTDDHKSTAPRVAPATRTRMQAALVMHEAEAAEDLRRRVEAAIHECISIVNIEPQSRTCHEVFRKYGISLSDIEAGKMVQASLEASLQRKDNLHVIAQKVTLLHDFPDEVGGGGFTNMREVPELRKKLLERLLEEISRFPDALKDKDFSYIFARAATNDLNDTVEARYDLQSVPRGNPLAVAFIEILLKRLQ